MFEQKQYTDYKIASHEPNFESKFQSMQHAKPNFQEYNQNVQPTSYHKNMGKDVGKINIEVPSTFDDVQHLIDKLKNHEQVIVDFTNIDQSAVFRIMDFMSGAIYALNGSIQQISCNIFLFAPSGVKISMPPQFRKK